MVLVLQKQYRFFAFFFDLVLNPADSQFGSSMGDMIKRVPASFARPGVR